jgi:hypothetical protein
MNTRARSLASPRQAGPGGAWRGVVVGAGARCARE